MLSLSDPFFRLDFGSSPIGGDPQPERNCMTSPAELVRIEGLTVTLDDPSNRLWFIRVFFRGEMFYNALQGNGSYSVIVDRVYEYDAGELSSPFYAEALYMAGLGQQNQEIFAIPLRFNAPPLCATTSTTTSSTTTPDTAEPTSSTTTTTTTTPSFSPQWSCSELGPGYFPWDNPGLIDCFNEQGVSFIGNEYTIPEPYLSAGSEVTCYTKPTFNCEAIGFNTNSGIGNVLTGVTASSCFENEGVEFDCWMPTEVATCATFESFDEPNYSNLSSRLQITYDIEGNFTNRGESIDCWRPIPFTCSVIGLFDSQDEFNTRIPQTITVPNEGYSNDGQTTTCYSDYS